MDVTIATPNPFNVNGEEVLSVLPEGKRRINIIKSGMIFPPDDINLETKTHVVVMVARAVLLDIEGLKYK